MRKQINIEGDLQIENPLFPMKLEASGGIVQIDIIADGIPKTTGLSFSLKNLLKINGLVRASGLNVFITLRQKTIMRLGKVLPVPSLLLFKKIIE